MTEKNYTVDRHLDACGLLCPEPVMLLHKAMREASAGHYIEVIATDPSTQRDIPNFCEFLGHKLTLNELRGDQYIFHIRKGG